MKKIKKIIKILFSSPILLLKGDQIGLLMTISIGIMGSSLFFIIHKFNAYGQPVKFANYYIFIYLILIILSNSYFANRISIKNAKANLSIAIISIVVIFVQDSILYYLHSVQILLTTSSLLLIALVSWSVAFICVEIWVNVLNSNNQ